MSLRRNKRRAMKVFHGRFHPSFIWQSAEDREWLDAVPIGHEFGSKDYARLSIAKQVMHCPGGIDAVEGPVGARKLVIHGADPEPPPGVATAVVQAIVPLGGLHLTEQLPLASAKVEHEESEVQTDQNTAWHARKRERARIPGIEREYILSPVAGWKR